VTVPFSDLQAAAPSALIELFILELNTAQHGVSDVLRFHSGTSLNSGASIVWAGNTYQRFPIEVEGFEWNGNGSLPRPTLRASNVLSNITAIIESTTRKSLDGAKLTRIRTLARYLDGVNFPGGINPLGTPDPTAEFPREVYFLDRKVSETRDAVEYEAAAVFDLAGVRAPRRLCMTWCQWLYRGDGCGYSPAASFTNGTYTRSGQTVTVTATAHGLVAGDYIYLDTTSGALIDGHYKVTGTTADTFTTRSAASGSTSGNVRGTQFYTVMDIPTWDAAADLCSKRTDGCKLRFGGSERLPFGGFPGVGQVYA
jgi:lambda family phage minor tail protein L